VTLMRLQRLPQRQLQDVVLHHIAQLGSFSSAASKATCAFSHSQVSRRR
jgi:hypothetical protein